MKGVCRGEIGRFRKFRNQVVPGKKHRTTEQQKVHFHRIQELGVAEGIHLQNKGKEHPHEEKGIGKQ